MPTTAAGCRRSSWVCVRVKDSAAQAMPEDYIRLVNWRSLRPKRFPTKKSGLLYRDGLAGRSAVHEAVEFVRKSKGAYEAISDKERL